MIASRVVLHLAALALPVLATVGVCLVFRMSVIDFGGAGAGAVLAAQIAALAGWPMLVRSLESRWLAPLGIGFLMAVITHLLFGPAFGAVVLLADNTVRTTDVFSGLISVSIYAAVFVGWATVPLCMAVCVLVNRLRRKELHRAAV